LAFYGEARCSSNSEARGAGSAGHWHQESSTCWRATPKSIISRSSAGRDKHLGRSFGVKLWPTLVFMRDGRAAKKFARPKIDAAAEQRTGWTRGGQVLS
jgi:hypothetical protein